MTEAGLKDGSLYGQRFATRRQPMDEVIDGLMFYQHRRLHSTPGLRRSDADRETPGRGTAIEGHITEGIAGTSSSG